MTVADLSGETWIGLYPGNPGLERRVFTAVPRGAGRHPLLVPLLDALQDAAATLRRTPPL